MLDLDRLVILQLSELCQYVNFYLNLVEFGGWQSVTITSSGLRLCRYVSSTGKLHAGVE